MQKILFGILSTGEKIYKYILENDSAKLTVMTFGATITSFEVFGRDIIGGYDNIEDYVIDDSHQGATIGRVANRIANAEFTMDGVVYSLPKNDGNNCLHGGNGFDRKVWEVLEASDEAITLVYTSPDGDEGFPAKLTVKVTFRLFETSIGISYEAIPNGKTPIALTNHSYFNLDGFGGTIYEHTAKIYAESYTEVNNELIPTKRHPALSGNALDLSKTKKIGDSFALDGFGGYDHNYVLKPEIFECLFGKELGLCAEVCGGGLMMKVYTDQPGIQFYSGNFLGGEPKFKGGTERVLHGAFCLETQTEPDCINSVPPVGFYNAGEIYRHNTVYTIKKLKETEE